MDAQATGGFLRFFDELPDPRAANHVHRLSDLFAIAICAVICGADSWVDVAMFAQSKRAWLSTFLDLDRGVPSHDTFGRVFSRIDPSATTTTAKPTLAMGHSHCFARSRLGSQAEVATLAECGSDGAANPTCSS